MKRHVTLFLVFALLGALASVPSSAGAALRSTAADAGWGKHVGCAGLSDQSEADHQSGFASRASYWRHQRCLHLNDIQVIGTHNSYKQPVPVPILTAIGGFSSELAASIEYSHSPLTDQFDNEEVRQVEIDVYADPEGGHLAERPVLDFLGLPNVTPPELLQPGFKVLHINDLDFNSSCLTLTDCLEEIRRWSRNNRGHLPLMILIEVKTDPIPDPLGIGFVQPLPVGPTELDALDAEIRSVFSDRHIIEPDEIRGRYETLEQAVLADRWPTLARSRNKVLFAMINPGQARIDYVQDRPSLQGRVMFTNSTPGQPDAAFFNIDDAIGDGESIEQLVAAGYLVRTRADRDTIEGRTGDVTRLNAALNSGAQWISTDYPQPGRAFVDYTASIPNGDPARCNPITSGPRCKDNFLERTR